MGRLLWSDERRRSSQTSHRRWNARCDRYQWLKRNSKKSRRSSLNANSSSSLDSSVETNFVVGTFGEALSVFVLRFRKMLQMIVDFLQFVKTRFVQRL